MNVILVIIGLIVLLVAGFIIYRNYMFRVESNKFAAMRESKVQPILEKLEKKEALTPEELNDCAKNSSKRDSLYHLLLKYDKLELFPKEYFTVEKGAESNLVNWLEFPTELDATPDEIVFNQKIAFTYKEAEFQYYVYEFRTNAPHWATESGWMLGVAGPYFNDSKPFDGVGSTFSRLSKITEISPLEEAKWVHENITIKYRNL